MEGGIGYGLGICCSPRSRSTRAGRCRPISTPIDRCASTRCRRSKSRSCNRAKSRPASASPACRRSGRRSPMRWRGSASDGRAQLPFVEGRGVMRTAIAALRRRRLWSRRGDRAVVAPSSPASRVPRTSRRRCGRYRPSTASATRSARSVALFQEAGKVLPHPRCVNCHPRGDRPLQTDRCGRISRWWCAAPTAMARRGCNARPAITTRISIRRACPGNPQWHLAPISMAWQGKSLGEICRADQGSGAQWRQGPGRASSHIRRRTRWSAGAGSRVRADAGTRERKPNSAR